MGEGSLSGWTEGIILLTVLLAVVGVVVGNMNGLYNKSNEVGLGIDTTADQYINYTDSADGLVKGGEADFNSDAGITLRSSWAITKGVYNIVVSFLTGGFVEDVFSFMNLGESGQTLAIYLRILWVLSLIFAVLYILFKVVA